MARYLSAQSILKILSIGNSTQQHLSARHIEVPDENEWSHLAVPFKMLPRYLFTYFSLFSELQVLLVLAYTGIKINCYKRLLYISDVFIHNMCCTFLCNNRDNGILFKSMFYRKSDAIHSVW